MKKYNRFIFFIGTEAEFIKLFPIMIECQKQNIEYDIIASGQNDITKSKLLEVVGADNLKIELSKEADIKKSSMGLLIWWFKTYFTARKVLKQSDKRSNAKDNIMIVHGDTVSTVMGAMLGKALNFRVAHIEAGLRSHNFLNPFPEEIDRMITSKLVNYHFAPCEEAISNLHKVKGKVINTSQNTLFDSLNYANSIFCNNRVVNKVKNCNYCVCVIHRQENLANEKLTKTVIHEILEVSKKMKSVFVLHKITEIQLIKYGLLDRLKECSNIVLTNRMEYFDFMKLLQGSQFVITDGGSNQEELSYMGKPALILRKATERKDGIGENAILWDGILESIHHFANNYMIYSKINMKIDVSPSRIIVDQLKNN